MKKCNLPTMEDRVILFLKIFIGKYVANSFKDDEAFFGVFDGHSTTFVPDFLVSNLFN